MWPNRRFLDLVGIDHPIVQAPMAGANLGAMAIAVSRAGGLGSLPCGMLDVEQARAELNMIRQQTDRPINVNFFCHRAARARCEREQPLARSTGALLRRAWHRAELGRRAAGNRAPFDAAMCALMVEMRPRVVSFHYGLPERGLLERLKAAGCVIQSSATTVEEARWLEAHGADAIIAQGLEAGGHRGMFLARDLASQVGTFALVPQVVDAVRRAGRCRWRYCRCARHRRRIGAGRERSPDRDRISACAPRPRSRRPIGRPCGRRATTARSSPTFSADGRRGASSTASCARSGRSVRTRRRSRLHRRPFSRCGRRPRRKGPETSRRSWRARPLRLHANSAPVN